jgi:hypothetical protein
MMMRLAMAVLLQMVVAEISVYAQGEPYYLDSAKARRATRERAVAHAGPGARALVESEYGDGGAKALLACSKEAAARLTELYNSGSLARIFRPRIVLEIISMQRAGDTIAIWICDHCDELRDEDCFDAFRARPDEFIYGLKKLSVAGQEWRAARLAAESQARDLSQQPEKKPDDRPSMFKPVLTDSQIQSVVGIAVVIGFLWFVQRWWRRRQSRGSPA